MLPATSQTSPMKWFTVIASLLFSAAFFGIGMLLYPLPWESASWPQTPGIISGFTLVETQHKYPHFDAVATYHYELDSHRHIGSDAVFSLNRHKHDVIDRTEAQRRAEALHLPGKNVQVFYDPDNHARSTIQPGIQSSIITFFLFGGVCLIVGLLEIWSLRRKRS